MKIVYRIKGEDFVCERKTAEECVKAVASNRNLGDLTVAKVLSNGLHNIDYTKNRLPECDSVKEREAKKGEQVAKKATVI